MLDECKGEKLEELLVTFSNIILRKVLTEEDHGRHTIARRLVLTTKMPKSDQNSLLPLALAHRASLTALLRRKEDLRARYHAFQEILDSRSKELRQREEHLKLAEKEHQRPHISRDEIQKAKKKLSLHWHGDARWIDVLMEGEQRQTKDTLYDQPFEQTWKQVMNGQVAAELSLDQGGLQKDLEVRIANQKARLSKWKRFRDELALEIEVAGLNASPMKDSADKQGLGLDFRAHKELTLNTDECTGQSVSLLEDGASHLPQADDYKALIESMQRELRAVDQPKSKADTTAKGRSQKTSRFASTGHRTSKIDLPAQYGFTPAVPKVRHRRKSSQSNKNDNNVSMSEIQEEIDQMSPNPTNVPPSPIEVPNGRLNDKQPSLTAHSFLTRSPQAIQSADETSTTELDEDEALAAEIVSLTMNAAPSPVKSKSSLTERTRRSMALPSITEAKSLAPSSSSQHIFPGANRPNGPSKSDIDARATLLERTRQSMSTLPTHEPRKSTHGKQLSKQFPTNQFETPQKQSSRMEEIQESTPPEKLFSGDADYASIFKSRPKIAMSPTPSPMPGKNERNECSDSSPLGGFR